MPEGVAMVAEFGTKASLKSYGTRLMGRSHKFPDRMQRVKCSVLAKLSVTPDSRLSPVPNHLLQPSHA